MSTELIKTPIPFLMMGLYLLIVVGLSMRAVIRQKIARGGKERSFEDFYTGNKSMSAFVVGLVTIVTFYSGTTFTGRVGFFYNYGVVALTTLFSSATSGVIMFFLAEKVWPISKRYHCSTLSDMMELRYQRRYVKLLTSLIIVSFNIIWLITEIRTLGLIVNVASAGRISAVAGSIAAFTVIIVYVCTGGIHSVAAVDSFSSLLMLAGSVVAVVYLIAHFYHGNLAEMFRLGLEANPDLWVVSNQGTYGFPYWFSSIIVSTVVMLVYPSNYMSICLGKSVKEVKKASIAAAFSGPWLVIYGVIAAAALGLKGQGIQIANPESAFLEMLSYSGNGLMLGLVTTFILAASLGTLDSTLISLSGILANDVVMNVVQMKRKVPCIGSAKAAEMKKEAGIGNEVTITRLLIIFLGVMALYLSTKQLTLMVLLANYASNGLLQVVPAVMGGLYWKKATPQAAVASMLSGVGTYLVLDTVKRVVFHGAETFFGGYFLGIPAVAVGTMVLIAVSLAGNTKTQETIAEDFFK